LAWRADAVLKEAMLKVEAFADAPPPQLQGGAGAPEPWSAPPNPPPTTTWSPARSRATTQPTKNRLQARPPAAPSESQGLLLGSGRGLRALASASPWRVPATQQWHPEQSEG